jgi:ribosomal protein L37E
MRSTIINKKKICISCGNLDYHFSKKMCKQCATVKSTSKRVEKYEEQQHDESVSHLVEDLDAFNLNITTDYINNPFSIGDAGGNSVSYKVYTKSQSVPYTDVVGGHRHRITRA